MLLLLLFYITNAVPMMTMGLNSQFDIVPDTFEQCDFDDPSAAAKRVFVDPSCDSLLCRSFDTCVSYIVYTPIGSPWICKLVDNQQKVNMIMFGLDGNNRTHVIHPTPCTTVS